ncbi:MAG TPA: hypothetical protein VF469_05115 [Kofleriaceae bacterium]
MHDRRNGFVLGILGGAAGLAAMELVRAITRPVAATRALAER